MAYLMATGLTAGYAGVPVTSDINFAVGAGDAVFVVGENGAGKSTLIRTLLGLLEPLAGSVSFGDGVLPTEVGYLPQRAESPQDFPASVWEVALSGRISRLGRRPFYVREDRAATEEALRLAGALDLAERPFDELSGGQRQRVLLARALASGPRLLVLDEPTTGLDPDAAASLWRTIDELRGAGAGIVAVTHDVRAATGHATHVLAMRDRTATFAATNKMEAGVVA